MNIALAFAFLLSVFATATEATEKVGRGKPSSLLCLIIQAHKTTADGPHEYLVCDLILEEEKIVDVGLLIDLPKSLVKANEDALYSAEWYVNITGATIDESYFESFGMIRNSINVPPDATITTVSPDIGKLAMDAANGKSVQPSEERRLLSSGQRTVLVVRVSVYDSTPRFSATQLSSYYFDMNSFSFARQYHWCSFGALQFVAYDSSNPVMDVLVPGNASSFTSDQLWKLALAAGAAQKQVVALSNLANHIAIVLPPGLADEANTWYAIGTIGYWWSLYNNVWGGYPNFIMHELGHNLRMGHAGKGTDAYGDMSDIMGYGEYQQFGVSKCFNGYHYWYLQWFSNRALTVNPYSQSLVTLAAFADYNLTSVSQSVVINVDDSYYLIYNRAKGVNYGVNDAIDKVTVAQSQSGLTSLRVAVLNETIDAFQVANYRGGTDPLTIKVCTNTKGNLVDYAIISIGIGAANCTDGLTNTQITASPTKKPTTSPTRQPTMKPTTRPTPPPTAKPTKFPTPQPTKSPTRFPTFKPTKLPTLLPTRSPTRTPTPKPTRSPTQKPTAKPTKSPTEKPTRTPTPPPTTKPTPAPPVKPSKPPTLSPSKKPSPQPTVSPTPLPSGAPTISPSGGSSPPPVAPSDPTLSPSTATTLPPVSPTGPTVTATPSSPNSSPTAPTASRSLMRRK